MKNHKPVKVGTMIKIKNGDYLAESGIVKHVWGNGEPTTIYEVRTAIGTRWFYRDQFTIAR